MRSNDMPWLTEEQLAVLSAVTVEILQAGNGTGDVDDEESRANAESRVAKMTPKEMLNQLRDDHEWRCKRLGFNPATALE